MNYICVNNPFKQIIENIGQILVALMEGVMEIRLVGTFSKL